MFLSNSFTQTIGNRINAVSYTHLDVYKRQVHSLHRLAHQLPVADGTFDERVPEPFQVPEIADVYKRQVRVKRGEWKGGFGGPDGGMHNHIFGSQAPTSYLLMENVFADNDKADQAYLWAAPARLDEASGNTDKAIQAWEEEMCIRDRTYPAGRIP